MKKPDPIKTEIVRKEIRIACKDIAQRHVNAENHLVEMLMEFGKIDRETAVKVASYYLRHKLAKLDAVNGKALFKHGMFLDFEVISNAVNLVNEI